MKNKVKLISIVFNLCIVMISLITISEVGYTQEITDEIKKNIGEWFPDPNLAYEISSLMNVEQNEEVSLEQLRNFKFKDNGSLILNNKNISNIEGMQYLNLKKLELSNNNIEDIEPLGQLNNLGLLYLNKNKIKSVVPLSNLSKLYYLQIGDNEIEDISSLSMLNLYEFWAGNNKIKDISVLRTMGNMKSLQLNNNRIKNVDAISSLYKNLETLSLGNNEIETLFSFKNFDNLKDFTMPGNKLKNVDAFSGRKTLPWMNLKDNQISDISGFSDVEYSPDVWLMNNEVSDISPLKNKKSGGVILVTEQKIELEKIALDSGMGLDIPLVLKGVDGKFLYASNVGNNGLCRINEDPPYIRKDFKSLVQETGGKYIEYDVGFTIRSDYGYKMAQYSAKVKQPIAIKSSSESKNELKKYMDMKDQLWRQDYEPISWSNYISVYYNIVEPAYADENSSQEEVDNALVRLKKAMNELKPVGTASETIEEKLLVARAKFLELLNEERKSLQMNTLRSSDDLNGLADVRADEQQTLFSHERPNGSTVLYAGRKYGFNFLDECLTDNFFRDSSGYQKSGEDIGQTLFNSWKSSPAHYSIMVRTTRQTHIGLSFVVNDKNTFRMYGVLVIGWN